MNKRKKLVTIIISTTILLTMILGLISTVSASSANVVTDPTLKRIIQLKLGLNKNADVKASDVAKITSIVYSGYAALAKIGSLNGLQYANNLKLLDINNCRVSSLASIKNLTALKTLVLLNNPVDLRVGSPDYYIIKSLQASGCKVTYNTPKPSPYLTGLRVSVGTLSPVFTAGIMAYKWTIPDTTAGNNAIITPEKGDSSAKMLINNSNVDAFRVTLAVEKTQTITIKVTAKDNSTTKIYTVTAFRPSSNSNLSGIKLSAGKLSPMFSSGVTSYNWIIPETKAGNSATISPIKANSTAKMLINGTIANSHKVSLDVGKSQTIIIKLTAQDNSTTKIYIINATRPSTNGNLSGIKLSVGKLTPAFSSNVSSYNWIIPDTMVGNSATISPVTANSAAKMLINNATASSLTVSLTVGKSQIITVQVTAQDNSTKKTYTITAFRPSSNSNLSDIDMSAGNLSPVFSSNVTIYNWIIPDTSAGKSVTITPVTTDAAANILINNVNVKSLTISLALGKSQTIIVKVLAQDNYTSKTYIVNASRPRSSSSLSGIKLSVGNLTPAFSSDVTSYNWIISDKTVGNNVTITPIKTDSSAKLLINNVNVKSLRLSLAVGASKTIVIKVIPNDKSVARTYTITASRPTSYNYLGGISISTGYLYPRFSKTTYSYCVGIKSSQSYVKITPIKGNKKEKIMIDGIETEFMIITVPNGSSKQVTISVIAPSGATRTYYVLVCRAN